MFMTCSSRRQSDRMSDSEHNNGFDRNQAAKASTDFPRASQHRTMPCGFSVQDRVPASRRSHCPSEARSNAASSAADSRKHDPMQVPSTHEVTIIARLSNGRVLVMAVSSNGSSNVV